MGVLKTLESCIGKIDPELVEGGIFYIELDKDTYDGLDSEINAEFIIQQEAKVPDMGKSKVLTYLGRKFIMVVNKDKGRQESFYLSFKTKII